MRYDLKEDSIPLRLVGEVLLPKMDDNILNVALAIEQWRASGCETVSVAIDVCTTPVVRLTFRQDEHGVSTLTGYLFSAFGQPLRAVLFQDGNHEILQAELKAALERGESFRLAKATQCRVTSETAGYWMNLKLPLAAQFSQEELQFAVGRLYTITRLINRDCTRALESLAARQGWPDGVHANAIHNTRGLMNVDLSRVKPAEIQSALALLQPIADQTWLPESSRSASIRIGRAGPELYARSADHNWRIEHTVNCSLYYVVEDLFDDDQAGLAWEELRTQFQGEYLTVPSNVGDENLTIRGAHHVTRKALLLEKHGPEFHDRLQAMTAEYLNLFTVLKSIADARGVAADRWRAIVKPYLEHLTEEL